MIDETSLVVQSNPLVAAQYRLAEAEQKLLRVLVSMIQPDTPELTKKFYRITIQDFACFLGRKESKSLHSEMKRIASSLRDTPVRIIKSDMTIHTSWVAAFRYPKNKGYIEFEISSMLENELLHIKDEFTQYYLSHIAKLTGVHTIRIYELIRQFVNTRQRRRTVDIDSFKNILGIQKDEYSDTSNMLRRIIKPAHKKIIDKTDITFQWRVIKESRKFVAIEFYDIETKTQIPPSVLSLIPKKYRESKRILNDITKWIELKGAEYVTEKLNYVSVRKVSNYSDYLHSTLANDYGAGFIPGQGELKGIREAIDFMPGTVIEYKGIQYTFNGMGLTMKNGSIMPVGEMIKQYKAGVLKIL